VAGAAKLGGVAVHRHRHVDAEGLADQVNRTRPQVRFCIARPDKHLAREAGLRSQAYRLDCDSTDGAHEGGRHGTVCGD
jgi:hypothetical protein